MEDKLKLKTYVASKPFWTINNEDMGQTIEYYAAFTYPVLFVRKVTKRWSDGSVYKLNIPLCELVEEKKDFLREFMRALPKLFIDIINRTATEEDYDATMVQLSLLVNELGDISKLQIGHVLKFLKNDP